MGKPAYVRLVEHGKQQKPLLHISAATAGRVQPKVPREFNCVQTELRKVRQVYSAIITLAEVGHSWS